MRSHIRIMSNTKIIKKVGLQQSHFIYYLNNGYIEIPIFVQFG